MGKETTPENGAIEDKIVTKKEKEREKREREREGQSEWRERGGDVLTLISLRMTSIMLPITMRKSKTFQGSLK